MRKFNKLIWVDIFGYLTKMLLDIHLMCFCFKNYDLISINFYSYNHIGYYFNILKL